MAVVFDSSWTLFLDRDGVINKRIIDDYVKSREEFELIEGVGASIAKANTIFGNVVVVTNQQGIGKGLMTERNLLDVHAYCDELLLESNAHIDAYFFAPGLASEDNLLRKPNGGMAEQAKDRFNGIDFSRSVMVGDSHSDMEFGKRLGMYTVFVSDTPHAFADRTVRSLYEWMKTI